MSHQVIEGQRLTIFCTETDTHGSRAMYEWLIELALQQNMGGATATKALAGFGQHHRLHHQHVLSLADTLPIIVQIIDTGERIDAFLEQTAEALHGYTFIRENVRWHPPNL